MVSYLAAACLSFVAPLIIYLVRRKRSPFIRAHAAQATNLTFTALLYTISALIGGGMLALDTLLVGLITGAILVCAIWLVTLYYLIRAGIAANAGHFLGVPGWLAARLVKP